MKLLEKLQVDLVPIEIYTEISGYSAGAIRQKIARKQWLKDCQYFKAPDGHIFISISGVEQWVKSKANFPTQKLKTTALESVFGTRESCTERL